MSRRKGPSAPQNNMCALREREERLGARCALVEMALLPFMLVVVLVKVASGVI